MSRLHALWLSLRASLWFVPTLVVSASLLAAAALVEVDSRVALSLPERWPRLFGATAEGSRGMLTALATSMMTVAGVIFSVTILALSMASTQYSPRVLRNFMRDQGTQLVLGVFVGIFAYCLLVLRTVRSPDGGDFVPSLAVFGALVYALVGVAVLIYFIHHVASSIQASTILLRIFEDTAAAIDRLYPQPLTVTAAAAPAGLPAQTPTAAGPPAEDDDDGEDDEPPAQGQAGPAAATGGQGRTVALPACRSGYVMTIEEPQLLRWAQARQRRLWLHAGVGDFVIEGDPLALAEGQAPVSAEDVRRVQACFALGRQRSIEQDPGFGLQQLAEVAVKALSPGINDPTTAAMCVDQLGALLARLAGRRLSARRSAFAQPLWLRGRQPHFGALLRQGLQPIVEHSRGELQVLARVLDALEAIGRRTAHPGRCRSLAALAERARALECRLVQPPAPATHLSPSQGA